MHPPPRPATGLVLGKFLPPHLGHQLLLDFALRSVDRLTVPVCTLAGEPIDGRLRHAWVAEMCPGARVVHVTDDNPQEPHEHPAFWEIWTHTVRQRMDNGPDVVFTSEDYGDELARRLGARHVPVDKARELVPVSGSSVRARPLAHWRFLPPPVRAHYVRRVVVFGPESTGKSTLARNLARHYETAWVGEYARGWIDHKREWFEASDLPWIVRGQHAAENALARQANRVLFCDTDALTTLIYSRVLLGQAPDWLVAAAGSRTYDHYLFLEPDVPFTPDAQRVLGHRVREMRDLFLGELRARGLPCTIVAGSWDERFAAACSVVERLLAEA